MQLNELIEKLTKIMTDNGDLPVYGACDGGYEFTLEIEDDVLLQEPWIKNSQHPELYPPTFYPKRVVIGSIVA